jgi:glycosyltransferase involved in cell wall biosynthesis
MNTLPLISIISVCYNSEKEIAKTIESVLIQTYRPLEYIIKDGKSTDNTLKIIDKYTNDFKEKGIELRVISEKDNGIYDAMNKAIPFTKGKWINFMNADDLFINKDSIYNLFLEPLPLNTKIVYGDFLRKKKAYTKHFEGLSPEIIPKRMPSSHQAMFFERESLIQNPYDTNYKFVADYHFIYKSFERGDCIICRHVDIALCEAGKGFSANNKLNVKKECAKVQGIDKSISWEIIYFKQFVDITTKSFFHKVLPSPLLYIIRQINHKRLA